MQSETGQERAKQASVSPAYRDFFECFNRQQFFESHEVLERLWLEARHGPDDGFYRGLIQTSAAFVHLQRDRLRPAATLLRRARGHLERYPSVYRRLDVTAFRAEIDRWLERLEGSGFSGNPLAGQAPPKFRLLDTHRNGGP